MRSRSLSLAPESLGRRGILLVAVPLLFQVVILVTLAAILRYDHAVQRELLAKQEVIAASNRLLGVLLDAETGTRGYALTGDRRFAEPYLGAAEAFPRVIGRFRREVQESTAAEDVSALERHAAAVMQYHRAADALIRGGRAAQLDRDRGKQLMDGFRAEMQQFVDDQRAEAASKLTESRRSAAILLGAVSAGFVINVVLALGAVVVFTRSIVGRVHTIMENTERYARGEPLLPEQEGADEIAELDRRFHAMAEALTAGREDLERANAELESFSYSVSHDLRSPLRALNGYTRILEEDYADVMDAEGRRYVATIRSEAVRLGVLIDDLLAFSRIGKVAVQWQPVDMEQLVRDVVAEVCPRDAQVQIEPLPVCLGDRPMLRHVITNLIGNAAKFSAPKGRVRIDVTATAGETQHVYRISDGGVGFDSRHADKLFGVFQRLHSGADFEGTGVGLAIVRRVIERHGGTVFAESTLGEGASFTFTLPRGDVRVLEEQA